MTGRHRRGRHRRRRSPRPLVLAALGGAVVTALVLAPAIDTPPPPVPTLSSLDSVPAQTVVVTARVATPVPDPVEPAPKVRKEWTEPTPIHHRHHHAEDNDDD